MRTYICEHASEQQHDRFNTLDIRDARARRDLRPATSSISHELLATTSSHSARKHTTINHEKAFAGEHKTLAGVCSIIIIIIIFPRARSHGFVYYLCAEYNREHFRNTALVCYVCLLSDDDDDVTLLGRTVATRRVRIAFAHTAWRRTHSAHCALHYVISMFALWRGRWRSRASVQHFSIT